MAHRTMPVEEGHQVDHHTAICLTKYDGTQRMLTRCPALNVFHL